jgi:uncharacterized protein YcbK (DUF882 family)
LRILLRTIRKVGDDSDALHLHISARQNLFRGRAEAGESAMKLRRREMLMAAGLWLGLSARARAAVSQPRRLTLKNANTGETFAGPYRDADGPIPDAIADLRILLRDHHVNQVGPLDVAALDFLADVLDAVGQSKATILSAYRTPQTNAMLATRYFGVAEKSQHLYGRALDVALDSRLGDAEIAARRMQRGGVGWYPISHFIHLDSGPTRNWDVDGSGADTLLTAQKGRPLTVRQRIALQRALARREFKQRQ